MSTFPKVLYLDDESINVKLFRIMYLGIFEVITCTEIHEALDVIKSTNDLKAVISDMKMPIMNGLEFIDNARGINSSIPYFILSGYDFNTEINVALENNIIKAFFQKPFDKEHIKSTLLLNI